MIFNAISYSGGASVSGYLLGQDVVYATAHDGEGNIFSYSESNEIGQSAGYSIYRGGLFFDTSSLSGTTILAAVLSVYGYADYSDTDFDLTIVSGASLAYPMVYTDYQGLLSKTISLGAKSTSSFAAGAWFDIPLNAAGIAAINKIGITGFGLRSSRDISSTSPSGLESIQFETANIDDFPSTHQPKLTINIGKVYPSDAITRVTGLVHRYSPGNYSLELFLGDTRTDWDVMRPELTAKPSETLESRLPVEPLNVPILPPPSGVNTPAYLEGIRYAMTPSKQNTTPITQRTADILTTRNEEVQALETKQAEALGAGVSTPALTTIRTNLIINSLGGRIEAEKQRLAKAKKALEGKK